MSGGLKKRFVFETTDEQRVQLALIAVSMVEEGLSRQLVADWVRIAVEEQGLFQARTRYLGRHSRSEPCLQILALARRVSRGKPLSAAFPGKAVDRLLFLG